MKKRLAITRVVTDREIDVIVNFMFTHQCEHRKEKAMLFDIAKLSDLGFNLSHLTKDDSVFFEFSREQLNLKYYRGERNRYSNLLSELQRYGQCRGYEVVIKSTTISY